jgi:hypothetical protein
MVAVAGVAAGAGTLSAYAADPGKPDPSPAASVKGLHPDPPPSARSAPPQRRVEVRTAAPTRSAAIHEPVVAAPHVVTPARSAPTTHARRHSAKTVHHTRRTRARHETTRSPISSPAFTAMLRRLHVLPTAGRTSAAVQIEASAAPARAPLLAAAAALVAVVLASGSLLALASRRSFWTEA